MKTFFSLLPAVGLVCVLGCGGGDTEEATEAPAGGEDFMQVPDSIIERDVNQRLQADPRLDVEGVVIEARSVNGEVVAVGQVPTRNEWSIVRQNIVSVPGVREVYLDSLEVIADRDILEGMDTDERS